MKRFLLIVLGIILTPIIIIGGYIIVILFVLGNYYKDEWEDPYIGCKPSCVADIDVSDVAKRASYPTNSFAYYLQHLPIEDYHLLDTYRWDGELAKECRTVFSTKYASVDMDLDTIDDERSLEMIFRLRAEYLWKAQRFHKISFVTGEGQVMDFNEWLQGEKPTYQRLRQFLHELYRSVNVEMFQRNLEHVTTGSIEVGDIYMIPEDTVACIVVDKVYMGLLPTPYFTMGAGGKTETMKFVLQEPHIEYSICREYNMKIWPAVSFPYSTPWHSLFDDGTFFLYTGFYKWKDRWRFRN